MRIVTMRIVTGLFFAVPIVAACSPREDNSHFLPERQAREFSEEDKRIARALSVSNNEAMEKAEGPYAQAVLCKHGMDVVGERFEATTGFNDQQRKAVDAARAHFDQRLHDLAASEGKAEEEVAADLERVAEDIDIVDSGRIAIDCLRRLQATG